MTEEKNAVNTNENETKEKSGSSNISVLKERFEIDFDKPLKEYNTNGAFAYSVKDKISNQRRLFALICSNETSARFSILPHLKSIEHPSILKLVEYGPIDDKIQKSKNMALIYQCPSGPKLTDYVADDYSWKKEPEKFKRALISLLSGIEALKGYGITHRAIRPDNIFYKDESKSELVLGDCAASFPAFHQPPIYETIESLMAQKEGRGNGSDKNDIYAAGIVLLSLIFQKNIFQDISVPEMLRQKLKRGTFLLVTDENKLPSAYIPLFKGMLTDISADRWDFMQCYNFMEGKNTSFSNVSSIESSKRAITINGEKLYSAAAVAAALQNSPSEAKVLINNGKFQEWIKNGLENEKLYAQIDKILTQEKDNVPFNVILSKICILINPDAPVRLNDTAVFPDGTPKAIFYALKQQYDIRSYIDIFSYDLIKFWYLEQTSMRSPANATEFKVYINRQDYGYGIERIMYDFDNDLPCSSPLLGNELTISLTQILKALDKTYSISKPVGLPMDKTIIAYLRCKMGKKIDGILTDINSKLEYLQISAILRLYTSIQTKYGPSQLPHLSQWIINNCKPLIKQYHSLKYQKYLEREVIKVAKSGKLIEIHNILENQEAKEKDKIQFKKALNDVNLLLTAKNRILTHGSVQDEESKELAHKFMVMLSVIVMIASFCFNLIYWILH